MLRPIVAFCCWICAIPALSQKSEIGLLLGSSQVPASAQQQPAALSTSIGSGLAFQATFAETWSRSHGTRLGFEVPFVAIPSQDVSSANPSVPGNFASLFITPGFRIRFLDQRSVSPWAAAGGGYARYDESSTLSSGQRNTATRGTNTGALQFGGGVDFKTPFRILQPIFLRAEIRDFYSGVPKLQFARQGTGQNNIVISGGFAVRF